jgi:hypothetical protein
MLRKLCLLLMLLLMILISACKKEIPALVNAQPTAPASELTPLLAQDSATPSPKAAITQVTTLTSEPTSLPAQSSATTAPTFTPFILQATSTLPNTAVQSTRRPTVTLPPEFSGFTPEELLNQGTHKYTVACQAWGACVCDSALVASPVTVTIEFTEDALSLSTPDGIFSYTEQGFNQYVLMDQDTTREIFFLLNGFQISQTEAGAACLLHTYLRDVSPQ